ncbi:MAG: nuclear transport factor 2 family protein [Rhodothermaceae bacterium]|nr:nuclear transport factor 2 family protein [Rhodothermaceae bacterium]MYH12200.1 nuclear transport factor 2 family protein [Rhodothermaceae bacterium]MYJ50547.1 nuclear transport factor 2 family protein [Rhodothermaceae bacterium]
MVLVNEKYGEVRGTGALVLQDDSWRIVQYHLTVPVPNDLLGTVVEMISAQSQ